ncbi:MAG TPA: GNAT family N-acetyltransferase [Thermofilum sp.]|nr:GNAT family N-acetyltransferase [Thermofilum sp.]
MEVEIREAGLKDYEGVSRLMKVLVGESVRERKEAWKKALRMGNYVAFVAEVKGRVVGFIDLFYFPDVGHGALLGYVQNLIVDESYRGYGIGLRLVRRALEYAREKGLHEVHVITDFDNKVAIRVYDKAGFKGRYLCLEAEL